jgi:hypothetical protein
MDQCHYAKLWSAAGLALAFYALNAWIASQGGIRLPVIRMEERSQKGARGVHVEDLAALIDQRRAAAVKEMRQLHG